MNGMPVVRFNATNQDYLWFYRPIQDNFTIICVFQSTQGYGAGTLYYQGAGLVNADVTGTVDDFGTCLFANGSISAGTGDPDTAVNSAAGFNDGHPHVMAFTRQESVGYIALYVDGTSYGSEIAGTESLTAPNQIVMGAQQTLNNYLSGDIAEVQIYNTLLPNASLIGIENSLKCKYGMTASSYPALPLGLTASAGNLEVSLDWSDVPGATSYNLWRSTNNGASYQLIASGVPTASYVDTTAIAGQTNFYEVAASDDCGAGVNSAAVSVYLPLPALGVTTVNGSAMSVTWPGWANNWQLACTTNLTPPVTWSPITSGISSNGGQFSANISPTNAQCFFQLSAP